MAVIICGFYGNTSYLDEIERIHACGDKFIVDWTGAFLTYKFYVEG